MTKEELPTGLEHAASDVHEEIARLRLQLSHADEQVKAEEMIRASFGHEVSNSMSLINSPLTMLNRELAKLANEYGIPQERMSAPYQLTGILKSGTSKTEKLAKAIFQTSSSQDQMKSNVLEDLVRNDLNSIRLELEKHEIKVIFAYDRPNSVPIYVESPEDMILSMISTCGTNILRHAEKGTVVKIGLRLKDHAILTYENQYIGDSRNEYGMNTGTGLKIIKYNTKKIGGIMQLYENPSSESHYDFHDVIGHPTGNESLNEKIFGVRMLLPRSRMNPIAAPNA